MRCDDIRAALSARLDGEPMTLPETEVTQHLAECATCPTWLAGAERVTRAVRVQPLTVPDLTASILAAVQADGALTSPSRPMAGLLANGSVRNTLRWVLGVLAVIQLMIAVPALLGDVGHDAHAGREVAALEIALAVGLLLAACYPDHARFFVPVVVTLVVCFGSASALDILEGLVTPGRVAGHVLALAQAVAVWSLARVPGQRPVARVNPLT